MTNSPPANIHEGEEEAIRVLTSGIDSLTLSYYLEWKDTAVLEALGELKDAAPCLSDPVSCVWQSENPDDTLVLNVAGHGVSGYPFLLTCGEYALKVGGWITPILRPSAVVEFRSETLHRMGVVDAVRRMGRLLRSAGAEICRVVVSRVDVFADVLIPEEVWTYSMKDMFVRRAKGIDIHIINEVLTGFSIGRGQLSCRLYDKPLEIASKSGKVWMYEEWELERVPSGYRIIRVEFQVRREKLKALGIHDYFDLMDNTGELWAYLTGQWFQVKEHPERQHHRRECTEWWRVIQNGYKGVQGACPLVLNAAVGHDKTRLLKGMMGYLTGLYALNFKWGCFGEDDAVKVLRILRAVVPGLMDMDFRAEDLVKKVRSKVAKFRRGGENRRGEAENGQ